MCTLPDVIKAIVQACFVCPVQVVLSFKLFGSFSFILIIQLNLYCKTYPFRDHPCIEDHIFVCFDSCFICFTLHWKTTFEDQMEDWLQRTFELPLGDHFLLTIFLWFAEDLTSLHNIHHGITRRNINYKTFQTSFSISQLSWNPASISQPS